jgi:phosphoserine phosphatase RsbU/P
MKFSFGGTATAPESIRQPKTTKFPDLKSAEVAALYRAARIGGDYFDFFQPVKGKMVFILMDVAGTAVQDTLHERSPKLLANGEDERAVTALTIELNAVVLKMAQGVCCAPAFLGCYDEQIHTITYVNAGHTPGLLKDSHGISELPPAGLPFGLFSHATHDAQFTALEENAAVVLASKGLVEARSNGVEFGMSRLKTAVKETHEDHAISLCRAVIEAIEEFEKAPQSASSKIAAAIPGLAPPEPNDVTTVSLVRIRR